PDSKKVAVASGVTAIYEVATGKRLSPQTESTESPVQQLNYVADGKLLAVWRRDKTIEVWDTAQWHKTATLQPNTVRFTAMAFSPAENYLTTAEGNWNQSILSHWDARTGKRLKEFSRGQGWIEALSYSADGATLAISQNRISILLDSA